MKLLKIAAVVAATFAMPVMANTLNLSENLMQLPGTTEVNTPEFSVNLYESLQEPVGKWHVDRVVSAMDDTESVYTWLYADSGVSSTGEAPLFVARCEYGEVDAYVIWHDQVTSLDTPVGDNRWQEVRFRVNDERAEMARFNLANSGESTFVLDENVVSLLVRMSLAEQVVFQTTPYRAREITAVFDVRGMRPGLLQVAEACN